MKLSDLGNVLKKIGAPILGTLVPGGGAVLDIIAGALGTESNEDKIADAIAADPEAALKLKALEATHYEELTRLALQMESARLLDIQSARLRDIEVRKLGGRNMRADILAYSAMGALVLAFVVLAYVPVPQVTHDALLQLIGSLTTITVMVYGFEFGSSRGSQNKDVTAMQKADTQVSK